LEGGVEFLEDVLEPNALLYEEVLTDEAGLRWSERLLDALVELLMVVDVLLQLFLLLNLQLEHLSQLLHQVTQVLHFQHLFMGKLHDV